MQIHAVVMAVKTMLRHAPPIASHSFLIESKLDNSLLYSQLAMEAHNMTSLNPANGLKRVVKKNVILYELR